MAGKIRGLKTQILGIEPKAIFTHCHAYALNLSIVSSCRNTYIRNMFGTLDKLHTFFSGPKHNAVLESTSQYPPASLKLIKRGVYRVCLKQDGQADTAP